MKEDVLLLMKVSSPNQDEESKVIKSEGREVEDTK